MLWGTDVWREMDRFRKEIDNLFSSYQRTSGGAGTYPLVNVYDSRDEVVVTAELPGISKDKVNITYVEGVLTLSGKPESLPEAEKMVAVRRERSLGAFEKTIRIPFKVEQGKINASYNNGILTIKLPKAEEAKPKAITIE